MDIRNHGKRNRLRIEGTVLILFLLVFIIQFGFHETLHHGIQHESNAHRPHSHSPQCSATHPDFNHPQPQTNNPDTPTQPEPHHHPNSHHDCPVFIILQTGITTIDAPPPIPPVSWRSLRHHLPADEENKSHTLTATDPIRGPPYLSDTPVSA